MVFNELIKKIRKYKYLDNAEDGAFPEHKKRDFQSRHPAVIHAATVGDNAEERDGCW